MALDTLSALDAQFVYGDTDDAPMNMGNVCIFEGEALRDSDGKFRLEDVRRAIASRLHLVPRYRRKVYEVPGGFAHPLLVDDPDFDIANHVKLVTLTPPGSDAQLKDAYARAHEGMLDHSRPLWEITFVDGLEGGRVGMIQKIHHAPFDGASTVDVMELLFDRTPEHTPIEPPPWHPEPPPDPMAVMTHMGLQWGERVKDAWTQMAAANPYFPTPVPEPEPEPGQAPPQPLGELAEALGALEEIGTPPETSLNQDVGPRRRYDWVPTTLSEAKEIRALVPGSTVNDVMLAVVGGGLRVLLASRGEDVDHLTLQVMVPVSLRTDADKADATGNQVTGFMAPLPVCEADDVERLRRIQRSTKELKEGKQALGIHLMTQSAEFQPPALLAAAGRAAMQSAGFMNLTVTNVPGPREELFLLGARMLELNPMVLIGKQITLNVAVESYTDKLSIGLSADADRHPDLEVLVAGIRGSIDALLAKARNA
jgi:diacylglycerol O-acyltransferase